MRWSWDLPIQREKKNMDNPNSNHAVIHCIVFSERYVDIFTPNNMEKNNTTIKTLPFATSTFPCLYK